MRETDSTPFLSHLASLVELHEAQKSGTLYTHHFNMLRRLMEQTACFLGYDKWDECIKPEADDPNGTVYLSSEGVEPGRRRLIAMDHGLCFIRSGEDLTSRLTHIDRVRNEHVYGLFPEFREKLREDIIDDSAAQLKEMDIATARAMIATVPIEWEVSNKAREAWAELIHRRAGFVADNVR